MKNINWRKHFYHLKYNYLTLNNLVLFFAGIIAISWAWGSIAMMQRNFGLQRKIDARQRQLKLTELELENLKFQQNYFKSDEYKELIARRDLDLALPGERVIILPKNSQATKKYDQEADKDIQKTGISYKKPSNIEQWLNFLSGSNAKNLPK